MGVEFHVNGISKIYVGSQSTYLGYSSEAGIQIEIDPKFLPIYTDAFGDQVPEDVQNMGMLATVSFELLKWDQTILGELQSFSAGGSNLQTAGPLGTSPNGDGSANDLIGTLLKQCGWTFPVWINQAASTCETTRQGAYKFSTCYMGPDGFNLGTRNSRHRITFNCLPNASGQVFQIVSAF